MIATESPHTLTLRTTITADKKKVGYFFGPRVDFFLLGGISFLLLPVALLVPSSMTRSIGLAMVALSVFIHSSHFANSYQLFYRGFRTKVSQHSAGTLLPFRYVFAGVVVPIALATFLASSIALGDMRILGIAFNVLTFFVIWHYVKQGYGILVVDAAFKGHPFGKQEKRLLLANAYTIWLLTWISANLAVKTGNLYGISYQTLEIPGTIQFLAIVATTITSFGSCLVLLKRLLASNVPVNGFVAYFASLYLWMLFVRIDPVWQLIVPALHSLQYLVVVWRYELNRHAIQSLPEDIAPDTRSSRRQSKRFYKFVLNGVLLGFACFWLIPLILQFAFPLPSAPPDSAAFFFACWVFINVHHYFVDNVIWRSENPYLRKFLFAKMKG